MLFMRLNLRGFALSLLLAGLLGCASGKTYSFQIPVHNATDAPLSVGLVKTGTPEDRWTSPAQVAAGAPQLAQKHWGTLVAPGETKVIGPQKGTFEEDSFPFLRVYRGDARVVDLLSIPRDSGDRLDVPIESGSQKVTIRDVNGTLKAEGEAPGR